MDSFKTDNSLNGNQMSDWLEVYNNEELNNSSSSLLESSNEEVYLSFPDPLDKSHYNNGNNDGNDDHDDIDNHDDDSNVNFKFILLYKDLSKIDDSNYENLLKMLINSLKCEKFHHIPDNDNNDRNKLLINGNNGRMVKVLNFNLNYMKFNVSD